MEHFFAYTSRMRFISRWALMRNSQPENIQEHSHQVAVLAHALTEVRKCTNSKAANIHPNPIRAKTLAQRRFAKSNCSNPL